ncbi:hypothetical protein [Actinoalloteichus spitiensis]|uniref:biotin synthase auxiliary protein BsaP n=1 Tax=Actinoalloteichus spitiensis TaxID=252394 RepID=UPI000379FE18|nr:hypothetical protein [Actinoalloteichus spitiensis]
MDGTGFCGWCGQPEGACVDRAVCVRRRVTDPPRYCPSCARRMVVQVTPAGWSARCSRHGGLGAEADAPTPPVG